MSAATHRLVRDFFGSLSRGEFAGGQLAPDMTFWSVTGGESTKDKFVGGVKMLQSLFSGGLAYTIDAITAEDDRAAAEVRSRGTLSDGQDFENVHVFTFRFRDGSVTALREYQNPEPVRAKLGPLIQAAMAKRPS